MTRKDSSTPTWPTMLPPRWPAIPSIDRAVLERAMRLFAPPPAMPLAGARWISIEYCGLHGLWGGEAIRIHRSGRVEVERGHSPARYDAIMSSAGLAELEWLMSEIDLSTIPPSTCVPQPDQVWFEIALVTPEGTTVAGRWNSEPHEDFDALREWMMLAAKAVIGTHAPSRTARCGEWSLPSRATSTSGPMTGGIPSDQIPRRSERTHVTVAPAPPTLRSRPPSIRRIRHVIPAATPVRCASLLTDGLRNVGFDEMILTVPEEHGPDRDAAPLFLIKSLLEGLDSAPRLGPGAYVGVRLGAFPGWVRVTGLAIDRAWPMDNVDMPPGCLSLHALVDEELELIQACGPQRLLARLAMANRFFPTPPWSDPSRASVATADEPTMLKSVSTVHLPGITATREDDRIVLRVARATQVALSNDLPTLDPDAPFAFLTSLHVGADACLSWRPGQRQGEATTYRSSRGERLGGSFLLLEPHRGADGASIVEDGFVMQLSGESARTVREALAFGRDLDVPATRAGTIGMRLAWIHDR